MRSAPDRAFVSSSLSALALALGLTLTLSGCCFGGGLGSPPPPPVPYPPPTPPVVTPPIGTPPPGGPLSADCMGLCQRTGQCMDQSGTPRGADEANCAASCAPGGAYANMPPDAHRCVMMPTCDQFDSCTGQAIAAMLAQILGGGAPTPPSTAGAPPGWPAGFPIVPGGTPVPAPAAGPVTVALLAYSGTTPDALEAQYRAELAASGWSTTPPEVSPRGAHRFQASRPGASISLSIYSDGAQTFIQTMQF